jgi:hypothetical protein
MTVVVGLLASMGLYEKSNFFTWGTPVTFLNITITDNTTYYVMLTLFFLHKLVNNWVKYVVYPWIINCVQDPKSNNETLIYSKKMTLLIINMYTLYIELDMVLIVSGIISQGSFVVMIVLANLISTNIINWNYIKSRNICSTIESYNYNIRETLIREGFMSYSPQ